MNTQKIQDISSYILLFSTGIAAVLVISGGILYLAQNGGQLLQTEFISVYPLHFHQLLTTFIQGNPEAIIELGLIVLVAAQILRVGLLVLYYANSNDYWFTLITTFILLVLLYSFIWRN